MTDMTTVYIGDEDDEINDARIGPTKQSLLEKCSFRDLLERNDRKSCIIEVINVTDLTFLDCKRLILEGGVPEGPCGFIEPKKRDALVLHPKDSWLVSHLDGSVTWLVSGGNRRLVLTWSLMPFDPLGLRKSHIAIGFTKPGYPADMNQTWHQEMLASGTNQNLSGGLQIKRTYFYPKNRLTKRLPFTLKGRNTIRSEGLEASVVAEFAADNKVSIRVILHQISTP